MRTKVVEIPNAWGWNGKCDRTAYEVQLDGRRWGVYCYPDMAMDVACRLDIERERFAEYNESETAKAESL